MSLPAGFFFFTAGLCCSFLLPGLGQAQFIQSIEKVQNHATVVNQKEQTSTLKSTERSIIKETVGHNQSRIIKSPQQFLQELPLPDSKGPEKATTDPFAAVLGYGWQEYRLEDYSQAKVFFLQAAASENAENRRNAEYGLMYTYLKLGDTSSALPLLHNFVARGEQLESTAPVLAAILFEQGDIEALQALLPKLSPVQEKEWQDQIIFTQFQQEMLTMGKKSKPDQIKDFIQKYRVILEECQQQEQFFRMASLLAVNSPDLAKKIFTNLSRCQLDDQHWQERVQREQLQLMSNEELLSTASALSNGTISESTSKRLLRETLWQRLDQLEKKDSKYDSFVQVLYEQDPNTPEAASLLAWSCYQRGEYDCARDIFSTLLQKNRTDDALLGLAYTLQKKGELTEALKLLDQFSDRQSTLFNQLRFDLHATLGGDFYRSENYKEALTQLKQAMFFQPEDVGLTKMLLWSRYHLEETKPLVEFLWQQYQKDRSADSAKSLSQILDASEYPVFTRKVMEAFAKSEVEGIRKIAGDYAFQQKHPVLADQIYKGPSPYAGSAVPALDTMLHFRSKEGNDGISSLSVETLLMRQRFSSHSGKTWSFSVFPLSIDSGPLPTDVPVGSVFLSPDQSQVQPGLWEEQVFAWGWRGGLQIEGDLDWDIGIGSTPLNGVVTPTLIGKIQGNGSDWILAVERDSVRESMLSWLGQTDPYSGREWGRVVQTSMGGAKIISFSEWWLTFEGKYSWYDGESVEQNSSLTASVSGGYTTDWKDFERSTGIFLFARGFERNSNFYTFGHGGYYSPAQHVIAGPFFRLATTVTSHYWLDVSCSAGLNYRKTDDAPHYAELETIAIGAEAPGWQDLRDTYRGESETSLGVDARIRGLLPLSNGWFVGGEASINNVADFTEWQMGVALRYRFGTGMGLGLPERDFSMLSGLVQ